MNIYGCFGLIVLYVASMTGCGDTTVGDVVGIEKPKYQFKRGEVVLARDNYATIIDCISGDSDSTYYEVDYIDFSLDDEIVHGVYVEYPYKQFAKDLQEHDKRITELEETIKELKASINEK